jgi:integrase
VARAKENRGDAKEETKTMSRDNLYKREYGIFCFRYKDKHGAWREKSTGATARAEAKRFKKKFDDDVAHDTLPTEKADWTVAQAATRWVEQHAAHLTSDKAKRNEQSFLRQLIRRLGMQKLKAVNLDTLKDYQSARRKEVRERPINLELQILVSTLKEANLWTRPLAEHYKRLKEPESEVGRALTIDELKRLEATAATNEAWEVAYCAELLAANTGVRGGELKKLRIGMVDLENRRIRIRRESTKTSAGARAVELNQAATEAVCRLYRRAQSLGARNPEHYLLPADLSRHTKNTDPLKGGRGFDPTRHQMSWDTAWRALRKAAGFDNLRFHSLRHTFITMMAEGGTPLAVTQAMVGHLGEEVTRHYTHISQNAARQAVEKLDRIRPEFVDVFVDESRDAVESKPKLLN